MVLDHQYPHPTSMRPPARNPCYSARDAAAR